MSSSLASRKCCCDPTQLLCGSSDVASWPQTLDIVSSQTWIASRCEWADYDNTPCCYTTTFIGSEWTPSGCSGGQYPPYTSAFQVTQTVTRTVIGTLHKLPSPSIGYVGNDPSLVPASAQSVDVSWSVSVSGQGTKNLVVPRSFQATRANGDVYRFCYSCNAAEQVQSIHSDGGTIYPRVSLTCSSDETATCQSASFPPAPFARIRIDKQTNGSVGNPVRIWYPSNMWGVGDSPGPNDMLWPPIMGSCPTPTLVGYSGSDGVNIPPCDSTYSYEVCPSCGATIQSGLSSCWACRTPCVPHRGGVNPTFYPSPIGYGTSWVSVEGGIIGQYEMVDQHDLPAGSGWGNALGPACSICDESGASFACPTWNADPNWCHWSTLNSRHSFRMASTGSLGISA